MGAMTNQRGCAGKGNIFEISRKSKIKKGV